MGAPLYGKTKPRIYTKPLRELTPETSRGFAVITFARTILHVELFPWQEWLLIHLLELLEDGTLRFRKALVIVGRQNGKTLIAAVLAAYWLYVDAARWPEQLREQDFVVVGAAQKLDIAMKPWKQVRRWGGPDDIKVGIAVERVPELQAFTYHPRTTNGETELRTFGGATYLPRTFDGARGHSAARLLLDELREQYDYEGWSSIEKSANAMFDSLLVAFSNAGTARSRVLKDVRQIGHESIDDPEAQWFIAEWSAKPSAQLDDRKAFQQANPSAGYLPGMTIKGLMKAAADAKEKNVERIEVLGQWVTAKVNAYIDIADWKARHRPVREINIPKGSRTVWSVDTSVDRSKTWIASATYTDTGKVFTMVRTVRPGNIWAVDYLADLAEASGQNEVVVSAKGCAAMELIPKLEEKGLTLHKLDGTQFAHATGNMHDLVRDKDIVLIEQPDVDLAVEGGVAHPYADNMAWHRGKSKPLDISGLIAETQAAYGLTALAVAPEPPPPAPPPQAQTVVHEAVTQSGEVNLASVAF
ncbi:MAG: hypothetical protein WC829_03490 [Hyphomicrobium sp.]|jgi:hypothetical protein